MKKTCFVFVLLLSIGPISFVGCGGGPEAAGEAEALEGMDDMEGFEAAGEVPEGETDGSATGAGGATEGGGDADAGTGDAPAN